MTINYRQQFKSSPTACLQTAVLARSVAVVARSGRVVVEGGGPALPLAQAWWRLQVFSLLPLERDKSSARL